MTLDLTYIIGGVAATGVVLYFARPATRSMAPPRLPRSSAPSRSPSPPT